MIEQTTNCNQCGAPLGDRKESEKIVRALAKFVTDNPDFNGNPMQLAEYNLLKERLAECKCSYCGTKYSGASKRKYSEGGDISEGYKFHLLSYQGIMIAEPRM